jgi:hypothetical protein
MSKLKEFGQTFKQELKDFGKGLFAKTTITKTENIIGWGISELFGIGPVRQWFKASKKSGIRKSMLDDLKANIDIVTDPKDRKMFQEQYDIEKQKHDRKTSWEMFYHTVMGLYCMMISQYSVKQIAALGRRSKYIKDTIDNSNVDEKQLIKMIERDPVIINKTVQSAANRILMTSENGNIFESEENVEPEIEESEQQNTNRLKRPNVVQIDL